MTTIGRPSNISAAAVPLRRRDLRSPMRTHKLADTGDDKYWTFFKGVPAISNYVQVLSNSADLVSYYPGVLDSEAAEPVPVEDGPVRELWEEIGGETAVSEWVSSLVVHLSVPGQGWFVPIVKDVLAVLEGEETDPQDVTWQVVSTADLKRLLQMPPTESIPEDDNRIWRIYDPDPQNSKEPTSSVRRVATQANILMLIDRRAETDLHTRIHAGVWPLPASLKSMTTPSGKLWADILEEGLISAAEPGALESRVPLMAFMEPEEAEMIKPPIKLSIDDGAWLLALEERTLKNLAIGLDAPQELTTGQSGMSHWAAWLIQEETYTQHLDPLIVRILRSLQPWWQAQVAARRIPNPEKHVIWRNPATAINRPNSFQEAKDLWDRFVISDNALRATADRGDSDIPDEAEVLRRIETQRALTAPASEPTANESRTVPDTNPLQAATSPSLDRLARRLSNIDAATLARLEREAAKQIRDKRDALLAAIAAAALARGIEVGDPDTLPQRLGKDVVTNLLPGNLAEPDDFNGASFTAILIEAQEETARTTDGYGISRDAQADAEDRATATTLLLAALAGSVISSLFRSPDTTGELGIDGAEWVPTDALRKSMDTAGGGLAQRFGDDAWELIGNGKRTVDGMTAAGLTTEGFEWQYGTMPRRTFEPHLNLDGFQFTRWNDPGLRQTSASTWVGGEFFYPQDHRGCRCNFIRTLVAVGQESMAVA